MARDKEVDVRRSNQAPPQRLDQQVERLFEDFFNRRWLRPFASFGSGDPQIEARVPRVDVVDRDDDLLLRAEMPGMSKDDIDVSVSDNSVTVKGSVRKESEESEGDYHRREIVSSYVSRTVPLPCSVDGDKAKARLKDGMLEVTLPKVASSKRKRLDVED
jgi:HSP20 family protein